MSTLDTGGWLPNQAITLERGDHMRHRMTESAAIDSRRDVLRRGARLAYIPPVILAALKVESTFAASGGGGESHKDNGKGKGKDKDKDKDRGQHKGRGKDKHKGKGRRPW